MLEIPGGPLKSLRIAFNSHLDIDANPGNPQQEYLKDYLRQFCLTTAVILIFFDTVYSKTAQRERNANHEQDL